MGARHPAVCAPIWNLKKAVPFLTVNLDMRKRVKMQTRRVKEYPLLLLAGRYLALAGFKQGMKVRYSWDSSGAEIVPAPGSRGGLHDRTTVVMKHTVGTYEYPRIAFTGWYLLDCGFSIGTTVTVDVKSRRITVTAGTEE